MIKIQISTRSKKLKRVYKSGHVTLQWPKRHMQKLLNCAAKIRLIFDGPAMRIVQQSDNPIVYLYSVEIDEKQANNVLAVIKTEFPSATLI